MLRLSISNLCWDAEYDETVFQCLHDNGVEGLEIAPTRIFPVNPYTHLQDATDFKKYLLSQFNLNISSIQSIWYGKKEKLFNSQDERKALFEYTKAAIDFAATLGCHNLVFGCPQNRAMFCVSDYETAISFFRDLGQYAYENNTVLSIEANPRIYNTNFITTTEEAIQLVKQVDSKGCRVNLDTGTIIYNNEPLKHIDQNLELINHIHISEPYLAKIQKRQLHKQLANIFKKRYKYYISVEMGKQKSIFDILDTLNYIEEVFRGI